MFFMYLFLFFLTYLKETQQEASNEHLHITNFVTCKENYYIYKYYIDEWNWGYDYKHLLLLN